MMPAMRISTGRSAMIAAPAQAGICSRHGRPVPRAAHGSRGRGGGLRTGRRRNLEAVRPPRRKPRCIPRPQGGRGSNGRFRLAPSAGATPPSPLLSGWRLHAPAICHVEIKGWRRACRGRPARRSCRSRAPMQRLCRPPRCCSRSGAWAHHRPLASDLRDGPRQARS